MRQIPAAACVARFWAQPPKYLCVLSVPLADVAEAVATDLNGEPFSSVLPAAVCNRNGRPTGKPAKDMDPVKSLSRGPYL